MITDCDVIQECSQRPRLKYSGKTGIWWLYWENIIEDMKCRLFSKDFKKLQLPSNIMSNRHNPANELLSLSLLKKWNKHTWQTGSFRSCTFGNVWEKKEKDLILRNCKATWGISVCKHDLNSRVKFSVPLSSQAFWHVYVCRTDPFTTGFLC